MTVGNGKEVLIAGGGIAGVTAACALAGIGYRSTILEQADEISEIGAGVQFGPNAVRMLRKLGIGEEINELAIYPDASIMVDSMTGQEVARIPYGEAFENLFRAPYALIHRADLMKKLLEAAVKTKKVNFKTGEKVETVEERDNSIAVRTAAGNEFTGAFLIGADGLWSTIRQLVIGDGDPRVSGHITYRAVLTEDQMPRNLIRNIMTLWAGDNVHAVNYPLRGGELYNLAATFHSEKFSTGWEEFGDPNELKDRFNGKIPELVELIDKIETWRMWVLCDRDPVRNWSKGRMTLVGDAAHPTLQYLGQGAAMSLEDGICLANELKMSNGDFETASRNYQEARYLRTARVQTLSRLYGEIYHANGLTRELRNSLLPDMLKDPYAAMTWMYDYDI